MKDIIERYLAGEATDEEKEQLFKWLDSNSENKEFFYKAKNIWTGLGYNPSESKPRDFDNLWSLVNNDKKIQNKTPRIRQLRILRYAASVAIALFIGWGGSTVVQNTNLVKVKTYTTVIADKGQIAKVILPDSSVVWLNSGSQLSYANDFVIKNRKVNLEGEAFFDVKHNSDNVFEVEAGNIIVNVLGTEFNLSAYPNDNTIETTLIEGKVILRPKNSKDFVEMEPNQSLSYSKLKGTMQTRVVDTELYSAWKDGKFVFRNESLENICKILERWYNVEIEIKNDKVKEYRYTGKIRKSPSIGYVLKMLSLTTKMKYTIQENDIEVDRIFLEFNDIN